MGLAGYRKGIAARVFRALALLVLALTILVPPGFMPARAADNRLVIRICGGTGPMLGALRIAPEDGTPQPDDPQQDPRSACPFAGHQAPQTLPPLVPAPLAPPLYPPLRAAPLRPIAVMPGLGLPAPPPPSQAPPFLSI